MLLMACICLITAVVAALISYKSKQPTIVLIAKFIFHLSLFILIVLFFMVLFNSVPPAPKQGLLPV